MNEIISIKFISYNLLWNNSTKEYSIKQFFDLVKNENPDIIALQNVNVTFFEKLGREMGYLGYKKYFPENFQIRKSGDMIFSKYNVENSKFIEFQKNTDRKGIFLLELSINNKNIFVCTAQIDNLPYLQTYQLNNINKLLEKHINQDKPIILGIDTNILEYLSINKIEGWYDAWYEVGIDNEKYTLDSSTNYLTPKPFMDRPDRILFKIGNSSNNFSCEKIKLLGIDCDISPHYGLMGIFKL